MPPLNMSAEQIQSHYTVAPSKIEVDYDKNITRLYQSICDSDWETAVAVAKSSPLEAKTWVVRHHDDGEAGPSGEAEIMWRFLPIHSACARQPPTAVISALLQAYPDGARCVDDQGMYPLHYACGNQASREVIRLLIVNFPQAAKIADPQGMLPIHYLACWGPSTVSVVDMVLVANRDACNVGDIDGNTPLDLALEGEYAEQEEVVAVLTKWAEGEEKEPPAAAARGRSKTPETMERRESPAPSSTSSTMTPTRVATPTRAATPTRTATPTRAATPTRTATAPTRAVSAPSPSRTSNENAGSTPFSNALTLSRKTYSSNVDNKQSSEDSDRAYNTKQVARLKAEIDKLKADKAFNEAQMDERIETELVKYRDQISSLENDLLQSNGEVSTLKSDLEEKTDKVEKLQAKAEENEVEISTVKGEKSDLERQLKDMTEQCEKYKARSEYMNDRLGSLSASLTSMVKAQEDIMENVKKQEEEARNAALLRQSRLEEILEAEQFMIKEMDMGGESEGDSKTLFKEFDKQKREMDAIAAVIAAARES